MIWLTNLRTRLFSDIDNALLFYRAKQYRAKQYCLTCTSLNEMPTSVLKRSVRSRFIESTGRTVVLLALAIINECVSLVLPFLYLVPNCSPSRLKIAEPLIDRSVALPA